MSPEFEKKLNFDSDTFSDIKRDMNFVLQRLLGNMKEKGSTEGSMTLKIDVSFTSEYIPNHNPEIEGESRKIEKPKFKHKVTSAVQIKDEKSGNLDTEMELVFDESQKECNSEIWINVYDIVRLLSSHRSSIQKTKDDWQRVYPYLDLDAEEFPK